MPPKCICMARKHSIFTTKTVPPPKDHRIERSNVHTTDIAMAFNKFNDALTGTDANLRSHVYVSKDFLDAMTNVPDYEIAVEHSFFKTHTHEQIRFHVASRRWYVCFFCSAVLFTDEDLGP